MLGTRSAAGPTPRDRSDGSIGRRVKRGVLGVGFGQVVNLLIQLASVPLFIHYWGTSRYGGWLALTAVAAYLNMSDLGFGSVAGSEMTMRVGAEDRGSALETFQSVWVITSLVSLVVLLGAVVVAAVLPLVAILNLHSIGETSASAVLVLMVAYVLVNQQLSIVDAGFRCEGNYGLGIFLFNLLRLAEFGVVAAVVATGHGPVVAALTFASARAVGTFACRMALKRVTPWLVFGVRRASVSQIKRLSRPAFGFLGYPLGNALYLQSSTIVASAVLGPTAVVVFTALRTLSRIGVQAMLAVNTVVWPEISRAFGAGRLHEVRKLHRRACQLSMWLALGIVLVLLAGGPYIVSWWTSGKVHVQWVLFGLLLAATVVRSLWSTSSIALSATNNHARAATLFAAVNVLGVGISVGAAAVLGLSGLACGALAVECVMAAYVLVHSLRLVDDRLRTFARTVVQPPLFVITFWRSGMAEA